jgi:hypothetical protein
MEASRLNSSVLSDTGVCTINIVTHSGSPSVSGSLLDVYIFSAVMETTAQNPHPFP